MHFDVSLNTILELLTVGGVAAIFKQLWIMNGSMREMKVWQAQHERQDDERWRQMVEFMNERN